MIDVTRLASAIAVRKVAAAALDAPGPEDLADAITPPAPGRYCGHSGSRSATAEGLVDDVFDGYGLLTADGVERLADGQLRAP